MKKYTQKQWTIFGEVVQNGKRPWQVAEETGFSIKEIKSTLDMWHREQPELFPIESEYENIKNHVSSGRRERENIKILPYSKSMDDGQIKQKF